MKYFFASLMLLSSFTKAYSKTADGYIITVKDDTVLVKIKVPGFFTNFNYEKVEIIDSSNGSKILTPKDIKGYGYNYNEKDYVYMSKITNDSSYYFLQQVITGKNTSLYQYIIDNGGYGSPKELYTFEKKDGSYMFMTNYEALNTFQIKLKLFYKDYQEVQKLIDTKFNGRRHIQKDIQEVLETVNKL